MFGWQILVGHPTETVEWLSTTMAGDCILFIEYHNKPQMESVSLGRQKKIIQHFCRYTPKCRIYERHGLFLIFCGSTIHTDSCKCQTLS